MKIAVLSMDIEDWYHLDYFRKFSCDREHSLLDGVEIYRQLLAEQGIPSSFFVLGELIAGNASLLRQLAGEGHDVGVHGWDHTRPLTMTPTEFSGDLERSKQELENVLGQAAAGYRAPCFSLDRPRLELVRQAGFAYDSSRIDFGIHPLYGTLDMQGFATAASSIYRQDDFYEFQVSTLGCGKKQLPISGGGYLRIFPWMAMKPLIKAYLKTESLYVLYIHPFELSRKAMPPMPRGVPWRNRFRSGWGRSSVAKKLKALIALLKRHGYRFSTFAALRQELLKQERY
jgi:polysaccharide deacetylase family protein (PEP-CTERM system associated)